MGCTPWITHHLRKAQLTPVSLLDQGLHEGRLGRWVAAVSPAPGEAAGAQEGLRERQQRGEGEAEGHAGSGVQGESTVSGCDRATSADLCPHPVTIAGCLLRLRKGCSAPKARESLLPGITSAPTPLLCLEHQSCTWHPALPNGQQAQTGAGTSQSQVIISDLGQGLALPNLIFPSVPCSDDRVQEAKAR